jgi:drug/metabolite transporter (DMT)-like permease
MLAFQVMFFGEVPNKYSISGAVLVTSSVLLTGLRKWLIALPEEAPLRQALWVLTR